MLKNPRPPWQDAAERPRFGLATSAHTPQDFVHAKTMILGLHEVHEALGATFGEVAGEEVVLHYGDTAAEHAALSSAAAVVDLGFRGRFCLTGADRARLLHGQVTNDVQGLPPFHGCYAAFVTSKGKAQADAFVYALTDELLVDVEPGLTPLLLERLQHYIVADDVHCIDVAPHYGLLSVQGPDSRAVLASLALVPDLPAQPLQVTHAPDPVMGDVYLVRNPRLGSDGFDVFAPVAAQAMLLDKLVAAARGKGGRLAGWSSFDLARIEAGIPRFGADIDDSNLAPEAGIESRAISYSKGCYIGQEVIARIRSYGQVAKSLRGLRLQPNTPLPAKGDRLLKDGKDVGYLTSVARSHRANAVIALGYVRRESNAPGTRLVARTASGDAAAEIVPLPFVPPCPGRNS